MQEAEQEPWGLKARQEHWVAFQGHSSLLLRWRGATPGLAKLKTPGRSGGRGGGFPLPRAWPLLAGHPETWGTPAKALSARGAKARAGPLVPAPGPSPASGAQPPPSEPRRRARTGKGAFGQRDSPPGPRWHSSRRPRDAPREGVCDHEKGRAVAPRPGRPPSEPGLREAHPWRRRRESRAPPAFGQREAARWGCVGGDPEAAEGGALGPPGRRCGAVPPRLRLLLLPAPPIGSFSPHPYFLPP